MPVSFDCDCVESVHDLGRINILTILSISMREHDIFYFCQHLFVVFSTPSCTLFVNFASYIFSIYFDIVSGIF